MNTLEQYLDYQLMHGRSHFIKEDVLKAPGVGAELFTAAATRLIKKDRLVCPCLASV